MKRIGITGTTGSGKSYVSGILAKHGFDTVNTDTIVHELYSKRNACTLSLAKAFGGDILNADHSINRRSLSAIVFADKEKLLLLNGIVHPYVIERLNSLSNEDEAKGSTAFFFEAPQLFEAGLEKWCDYVIAVIADMPTRLERIMKRDSLSRERALTRIANQHDDAFFAEQADYCINNSNGSDPSKQVESLLISIGLLA